MSEQSLTTLVRAMGIAAFVRRPDGSFEPLADTPDWFRKVTSDTTFPFLGHILEEAATFWQRGTPGSCDFGPCAEVDEAGREYHYLVTAITADGGQYLTFQVDPGADRMRDVLQKVRSQALSAERDSASHDAVAAELRRTGREVEDLLQSMLLTNPTPSQREILNTLSAKCLSILVGVAKLIRSTSIPRA